jgi:dipeptidyl aminopeptidase/acylaminoacyl peptidase
MNADGTNQTVLPNTSNGYELSWSPDGTKIVFASPQSNQELYVINADGTNPTRLAEASEVTIRIYNIKGELVRTLNLDRKEKGFYLAKDKAAYWDGRNAQGERVASGLYLYQFQADSFFTIKKMLILK